MKTLVLFSRCELVHLYGRISNSLSKKYFIIHIAYSDKEEKILRSKYGIFQVINFKKEITLNYHNEKIDLKVIDLIDSLIIEHSNERFNLNSSIQSDRTFEFLSYNECLLLCQIYYKFWNDIISSRRIDYILHEPNSLFMNQIASIICNQFNTKFISQIQVYGIEPFNFLVVLSDNGISEEISNYFGKSKISIEEAERITAFLYNFRNTYTTFFNKYAKRKINLLGLLFASFKIILLSSKNKIKQTLCKFDITAHLELFHLQNKSLISEIHKIWSNYLILKYDEYRSEFTYYYYPIHSEPEAVVLYWGDGIYKNQVKLIENIAAQLPPNCYLYVKDHPHAGAYRNFSDYKKIKAIPNVKLLNPDLSGKRIITNSLGVITINGTSGFEALLLNKQVYTFGNCFYNQCPRVKYINNIRDLRQVLYANFNVVYEDDEVLLNFISIYLKSIHPGFTDYFVDFPKLHAIDEDKNAEIVAKGLIEYFERLRPSS